MQRYFIAPSTKTRKKFDVFSRHGDFITSFGDARYEDFTTHGDEDRRDRYIARHEKREDWSRDGIDSAGFWSRWILWEEPTFREAIRSLNRRFDLKVKYRSSMNP